MIAPDSPEAFDLAHDHARARALAALRRWGVDRDDGGLCDAYAALESGGRVAAPDGSVEISRDHGLAEEHEVLRRSAERFAERWIAPRAEAIHRDDLLLPEDLLEALADLGAFGVSIPEAHGGSFAGHRAVVVLTEELSRASLGAGGSVVTRPEICAKALLGGGTDAQKARWLPAIAAGEVMVAVAVTEPDAGSDVAAMSLRAERGDDGVYRLHGEKTWCTFAGRADLLMVLARTGPADSKARGLSMFLVDKPVSRERSFSFERDGGGLSGRAIPTVGYRGMHSFSLHFEGWPVPADQRIGEEGQGFGLCMEGFSGGRLQTAARALGVMEAALRATLAQVRVRRVFGKPLIEHPLPAARVREMAARVQAGRQLAYEVADGMDAGGPNASVDAAVVKLLTCADAEWVTRQAMQLHGGMGYAEECVVSRLWQDARVLTIFEGAEEVLALRVVARHLLRDQEGSA